MAGGPAFSANPVPARYSLAAASMASRAASTRDFTTSNGSVALGCADPADIASALFAAPDAFSSVTTGTPVEMNDRPSADSFA